MKTFWKKKLPACLLALALLVGTMPAVSAAWSDVELSVDAGDEVTIPRNEFRNIFEDDSSEDFYYLEFTSDTDLDDYGYFLAYDVDEEEQKLYEGDFDNIWFYYYDSDVSGSDYALSDLTFVAHKNAPRGTVEMDFELWGDDDSVEGTLYIDVDGGSGDVELTYKVDPGDDVTVDAENFWDLCDE